MKPKAKHSTASLMDSEEDRYFVHKTLGLACLGSFVYRFCHTGKADMQFRHDDIGTLATLLLHATLSFSSLIFRIPQKRIKHGFRIWPEYRLHSIVFALRNLLGMLVTYYYGRQRHLEQEIVLVRDCLNTGIVLLTCALADIASQSVRHSSSTIRNLDASPLTKFHFSVMQFHATTGCLFGSDRYSLNFIMLFIVQFNSFLMTLQRKNIGRQYVMVSLYGLMLVIGFCVGGYEVTQSGLFWIMSTVAVGAALLRMVGGLNKYLLWTTMGVIVHFGRPTKQDPLWKVLYCLSMMVLSIVAYQKVQGPVAVS